MRVFAQTTSWLPPTPTARLIERAGQPWMAIEIKRSTAPTLSKGFDVACADLNIEQRYVVYPGTDRFAMRYGAQAIGLRELMQVLQTR